MLLSDATFRLGPYGRIHADGEKGLLGIDGFPFTNGEPFFVLCAPGSGGGGAGGTIFIAAVADVDLTAPIVSQGQRILSAEAGAGGVSALTALVEVEMRQEIAPDPLRRLAALLPADPRVVDQVAARLRLSAAQRKRLVTAAAREGKPGDARTLAYRLGREEAIDRLLLAKTDVAPLTGWAIPEFPLKGGEIVARGISAGPKVAQILHEIEDRGRIGERVCRSAKPFALQVSRVQDLLELVADGDGEHGFVQVHGLAHEREAAAHDDGAGRGEIVDEPQQDRFAIPGRKGAHATRPRFPFLTPEGQSLG